MPEYTSIETVIEDNSIPTIDKLSRNINGSIFIDDGDLQNYTTFFFSAILFWSIITYQFRKFYSNVWPVERYQKKNEQDKLWWDTSMTANVHHITVCFLAMYSFYYPECEGSYPFQQFSDDICFLTVQKKQVYLALVSFSYFVFDLAVLAFLVRGTEMKHVTMYVHHFCCICSVSCGLYCGYGLLVPGVLGILAEASAIFMNYRSLLDKEHEEGPSGTALLLLFAITFILLRPIMLPFAVYQIHRERSLTTGHVDSLRQTVCTLAMVMFYFVVIMNYYWTVLLIKKVMRRFTKKQAKEEDKFVKQSDSEEGTSGTRIE